MVGRDTLKSRAASVTVIKMRSIFSPPYKIRVDKTEKLDTMVLSLKFLVTCIIYVELLFDKFFEPIYIKNKKIILSEA